MEHKFEELLVELYGYGDDFYRISDSIKQIDGHQAMLLDDELRAPRRNGGCKSALENEHVRIRETAVEILERKSRSTQN